MRFSKYALSLVLFSASFTYGQTLPDSWKRVGLADLKVLWFDIYRAELFSSNGQFEGLDEPLLLKLTYLRDIRKSDLLEETRKQIQPFAMQTSVESWLSQLDEIGVDIKKGDELAFLINSQGVGHFFSKDRWLGAIEDPAFGRAFIQIWLSDQSSYPQLAKQLRGESNYEVSN